MLMAEKVLEKEFQGRTTKEAYLDCCKWMSTKVIAVNNSNNVVCKMEKVKKGGLCGVVKITLYVAVDEEEVYERHCAVCNEVSGSFFMKQNKYKCEMCKVPPYRKRLKDKLQAVKDGLKGRIL